MSQSRQFISAEDAQAPFFVGVDVGGTNIKVGVVDDLGQPLSWLSLPTDVSKGPQDAVRRMAAAVHQAIADAKVPQGQVVGIGLGTPGTLDTARGLLLTPSNLPGWWSFPIRDELSRASGLPVTLANDAAAAGYGEFWVGSGRAFHSMVLFTLGTGVGGAIIIGELSIDGDHGNGAELGHTIIDYNKQARLCSCGHRGHLEAYVGAPNVVSRAEELVAAGHRTSLSQRLGKGRPLTPLVVAEEAEREDPVALQVVLDTARYLGIGVVNALHTIDPSGVLIGGAMTFGGPKSALGQRFLAAVREEARSRALAALAEQTTIEFASLGSDAGFIGAAGIARRAARSKH